MKGASVLALGLFLCAPLTAVAQSRRERREERREERQERREERREEREERREERREARRGRDWNGYGNWGGSYQLR
ncbi:MAG TPA: hypothetical protein VGV38_15840, partial [Pyrinomonadaceae bacterium]|nr:hypothetical protein [Pyrinomonadaceae bacterium]